MSDAPDAGAGRGRGSAGGTGAGPRSGSGTGSGEASGDVAGGGGDRPVLAVEGVDSGYGDVQVLYDCTVTLYPGEVVCLIGPNGAGKSTVLKTAFGLLEAWRGSVWLRDTEITGLDPPEIVRLGMGYVPQVENVFGSLSVTENLRMGGVARAGGVEGRIAELRGRFPLLEEKASAKAKSLSGGQRQIVAFARALMTDPDVLLIDEPSAGLAPDTAEEVLDRVSAVNDAGTAVVIVEQNARAGLRIADRGYVLDQGRVRFERPADELLDDEEVAELYLGG